MVYNYKYRYYSFVHLKLSNPLCWCVGNQRINYALSCAMSAKHMRDIRQMIDRLHANNMS